MLKSVVVVENTNDVVSINNLNESLVERFIKFAGVTEKSAKTYVTSLKQMFKYFYTNNITQPQREDIENWRDELISDDKSASTVRLYLTSAKLFFRWLAQEGIYDNISDHLKSRVKFSHEHKKDALSATQSRELLQAVKGDSLKALRDRAIMALMVTAGLRTVEVIRADVGDIRTTNGRTFIRVQGKGHSAKDQSVMLASQVKTYIDEYIVARKAKGEVIKGKTPLFVSHANRNRNCRLQTQTISKMIKANLRSINLDSPRLTAHSLRHSAATNMILAGVELTKVQQVLRHVNINTTMIYNNSVERMRNVAEQTVADTIFAGM